MLNSYGKVGKQTPAVIPLHGKTRKYEGAAFGRRTEGWDRTNRGVTADQMPALRHLRGLSRDLVRNNRYAKRAIEVISTSVVGSGISPAFGGTASVIKIAKQHWAKWGTKTLCDFNELMTFYGIQKQVMRAVAESGDAIVLKRANRENPYIYELQILESDFLDEGKTQPLESGGFILQGVEFDSEGKRRGYWLFREHPGETIRINSLESRFVPKSDVIHVFEVLRPGQVRGIPMGVSCFLSLKDFDEYQDFQLFKQKVAACFVMVVTDQGEKKLGHGLDLKADDDDAIPYAPLDKMGPGIIEYLPEGKQVNFSQPPSVDGYDEYTATVLRGIAVGYGVTYESITSDYSKVNFTSARAGNLTFQQNVTDWQQNIMVPMFCDPAFSWFENGLIINGFLRAGKVETTWTPPRREMIDPVKEGKARIEMVRSGFASRQNMIRENGEDPDDVNREIEADMREADRMKAKFDSDPRHDPAREKKILDKPK